MAQRKHGSIGAVSRMWREPGHEQDAISWVLVSEGAPDYDTGFVIVRLDDGTCIGGLWRPASGWVGMAPDTVRKVIAWAVPMPFIEEPDW